MGSTESMYARKRFLDNPKEYPRGPLQPRDAQLVLGNRAWSNKTDHYAIHRCLEKYGDLDTGVAMLLTDTDYDLIAGADYPSYDDYKNNFTNESFFQPDIWQELQKDYVKTFDLSSAGSFPLGN